MAKDTIRAILPGVRRALGMLACFALLQGRADTAGSAVARLADAMAGEVLRVAKGRALELAAAGPEASSTASDWRRLLVARLEERGVLAEAGAPLRIDWTVSEAPGRLVASARLIEEPTGRLVDILSVSAGLEDASLPLEAEPAPVTRSVVDVVAKSRSAPIEGVIRAVGWLSDDRLLTLSADEAAVYRVSASALSFESRHPLPRPPLPVRAPGALVIADGGAAWTLGSGAASALLLAEDGGRLVVRARAEALPWSGSPTGLRFRTGTNQIELSGSDLGAGPFLALDPTGSAAVDADGELRLVAAGGGVRAGLRVGSAIAALWPGLLALSSPAPPGEADAVWLVTLAEGTASVAESLPLDGSIRALGARSNAEGSRLVASVEEPGSQSRLVLFDLRRRRP
jgi:hypothetical protein